MKWNVGVLTISDTRTKETDISGSFLSEALRPSEFLQFVEGRIVKDDMDEISGALVSMSEGTSFHHLILTTGGTGLAPRDVTPEATAGVLHRRASGIEGLLLERCRKDHPFGCLSRLVAGTRNKTLIINFPGSVHAVESCFKALDENGILLHALDLINGHKRGKSHTHHHGHDVGEMKLPSIVSRPRKSPYKMYEVHEAVSMVLNKVGELAPITTEAVQSNDFMGRILASDVVAMEPYPNTPVSIKDGYAVLSSDKESTRRVISSVEAGNQLKTPVSRGEAVRITTGAPLPPGADSVVQVEDTVILETTPDQKEEKLIQITTSLSGIKPGTDVRDTGSDIQKGSTLFKAGTPLRSAELGVLSTAGVKSLNVHKIPTIAVLSTGNELIGEEESDLLRPGFIRDSNKTYLKSLLSSLNYKVLDGGTAKDCVEDLVAKLVMALSKADVLITMGGVSMGEKDLLKFVLTQYFKAEIVFGRVFMKPGKPMTFAVIPGDSPKFIFALPGNPVSTAVTTEVFVLPALRKMKREEAFFPPSIRVPLPEDIPLDPRPEFKRVVVLSDGMGGFKLSLTGNQISSRLLSCVGANGLLRLPPRQTHLQLLPGGSLVEVLIVGSLKADPDYASLLSPTV